MTSSALLSKSLVSIRVDFSYAQVCRLFDSLDILLSIHFSMLYEIVPRAPTTIRINVTYMFLNFCLALWQGQCIYPLFAFPLLSFGNLLDQPAQRNFPAIQY